MQIENKIAMFIDVDNCAITRDGYDEIMQQINSLGKIVYGKFYGVSDRKHAYIIKNIDSNNYEFTRQMQFKKRRSSVFDYRIALDVIEYVVSRRNSIDAVAIVCAGNDLLPLYSKLVSYGIQLYALTNADESCQKVIDRRLDLPLPSKSIAIKNNVAVKKVVAAPIKSQKIEEVKVASAVKSYIEQPKVEDVATKVEVAKQVEEVKPQPVVEQPIVKPVVAQPTAQPVVAVEIPDNSLDFNIEEVVPKQVEDVAAANKIVDEYDDQDAKLLEEIKKLLLEFNK